MVARLNIVYSNGMYKVVIGATSLHTWDSAEFDSSSSSVMPGSGSTSNSMVLIMKP